MPLNRLHDVRDNAAGHDRHKRAVCDTRDQCQAVNSADRLLASAVETTDQEGMPKLSIHCHASCHDVESLPTTMQCTGEPRIIKICQICGQGNYCLEAKHRQFGTEQPGRPGTCTAWQCNVAVLQSACCCLPLGRAAQRMGLPGCDCLYR